MLSKEESTMSVNNTNNVQEHQTEPKCEANCSGEPHINNSERPHYEVVFFAGYENGKRPSVEDITTFFNNYGVVHRVKCPVGKDIAFVYMTSLNTTETYRRTHSTIKKIISDMTPDSKFYLTVASSNRNPRYVNSYNNSGYHNGGYNNNDNNGGNRMFIRRDKFRQEQKPYNRNGNGENSSQSGGQNWQPNRNNDRYYNSSQNGSQSGGQNWPSTRPRVSFNQGGPDRYNRVGYNTGEDKYARVGYNSRNGNSSRSGNGNSGYNNTNRNSDANSGYNNTNRNSNAYSA